MVVHSAIKIVAMCKFLILSGLIFENLLDAMFLWVLSMVGLLADWLPRRRRFSTLNVRCSKSATLQPTRRSNLTIMRLTLWYIRICWLTDGSWKGWLLLRRDWARCRCHSFATLLHHRRRLYFRPVRCRYSVWSNVSILERIIGTKPVYFFNKKFTNGPKPKGLRPTPNTEAKTCS